MLQKTFITFVLSIFLFVSPCFASQDVQGSESGKVAVAGNLSLQMSEISCNGRLEFTQDKASVFLIIRTPHKTAEVSITNKLEELLAQQKDQSGIDVSVSIPYIDLGYPQGTIGSVKINMSFTREKGSVRFSPGTDQA